MDNIADIQIPLHILIVRFSSFGDIVQSLSVIDSIKQLHPHAKITFLTKSEFAPLVALHPLVDKVMSFNAGQGPKDLYRIALKLRHERVTHFYDAHQNLRSLLLSLYFRCFVRNITYIIRPKERIKRILLFFFKINFFPKPFKGIESYLAPLRNERLALHAVTRKIWRRETFHFNVLHDFNPLLHKKVITLCPGAAWEMKRWPSVHWKKLIILMPDYKFIVLGGVKDFVCKELEEMAPGRVRNFAGKLSYEQTFSIIAKSNYVVSADTGTLHIADLCGTPAAALMGPTAFGFTTHDQIDQFEVDLTCRPCTKDGRGLCSNDVYQRCMVEIEPFTVVRRIRTLFG